MRVHPLLASVILAILALPVGAQFGAEMQFSVQGPRTVDPVDLDGDADLDLLIGTREGTHVMFNFTGLGGWTQPTLVSPDIVVASAIDVNGDGSPDMIGGKDLGSGLVWAPNTGAMAFGAPVTILSNLAVAQIKGADIDQDGDQDLLVRTEDGLLLWLANTNGLGSFGPAHYLAATDVTAMRMADINGDGSEDMVWSSAWAGEVHCATNLGGGNYGPSQLLTSDGHGDTGDLDGDGHPDVITANPQPNGMKWRRNTTGNGVLASPTVFGTLQEMQNELFLLDLDVDGDLDLLTGSGSLGEIAFHENTDGQGTYGPRQLVAINVTDVASLATGDIDGDGDPEVFAVSPSQNRVVYYDNLAFSTGRITGRVFNDINGDGLFNGTDHGLNGFRVEVAGLGSVFTNHSGMYWLDVPTGSFAVSVSPSAQWTPTTPVVRTASLQGVSTGAHTDFGLTANGPQFVLSPAVTNGLMRCSEETHYWITVRNDGNTPCDINLALDLDSLVPFVYADIHPLNQGGIQYWSFANVQPTHQRAIALVVQLPGAAHLGELMQSALTATAVVNGAAQTSTTVVHEPMLVCAYDPNDKQVKPVGTGEEHYTPVGTRLTYTVRFQNTGNSFAEDVEIVDQLDAALDPQSLRLVGTSHVVRTSVSITGEVRFRFEDIMLPDSTTDLMGSQGYVSFTVDHLPNPVEGTAVLNTAGIYFDQNPPIITNTVLNTLTYGTTGVEQPIHLEGSVSVFPNPARDMASVQLGADIAGDAELTLTDAMGRKLRTWRMAGGTKADIPRYGLNAGLYLLRVSAPGMERTVRLVFE